MSANGQVVVATDLHRRYGEGDTAVDALDGVTTGFERDRFTAIMGPSGSGKSTLMHILAGLDKPTSGTVELDGVEITALDDGELTKLRRDKLGFVFQFFNLLPVLTAEENVLLPLRIAGERPDPGWLETLIDTVGLGPRRTHRPSELSGGQQQRVAVARALVHRPAVVFAGDRARGLLDAVHRPHALEGVRGHRRRCRE
ncbi:MAG TPA: ABC transporter ATP-binding protein, partial [Solirubrobacterales bacterium]|nr:ABC transporter ATP-binding protein [Solirubrobacterales bacterium]